MGTISGLIEDDLRLAGKLGSFPAKMWIVARFMPEIYTMIFSDTWLSLGKIERIWLGS
jgi:hypothetical protein